MGSFIDVDRLAALMRAKRANRGLREIAKDVGGVSPSTLSRVENAKMTDMETFLRLCDWLEISPNELILDANDEAPPSISTPDSVALHLRADPNLDPLGRKMLEKMFRAAYEQAVNSQGDEET